jgi:SAM-dependent methyltransferase
MSQRYDAARFLEHSTFDTWRAVLAPHVEGCALVLDVGSGTGRFSIPLAEWSGGRVVGVEPADGMRAKATQLSHARVRFIGGRAECLPFGESTFGAALLSNVFHHIKDRHAASREIARVLKRGSKLLVRGAFGDRLEGITLFDHFPEAREVCEGFPTLGEAIAILESAGFEIESVERIEQQTCGSLREAAARTALRADTTLALIPDDVFAARQQALEQLAQVETDPRPVIDRLDLVVARKLRDRGTGDDAS